MKQLAIVTPNTDTFTNPTLTSLFHLLSEQGVHVYLFGPEQQPACPANLPNVQCIAASFKLNMFRNPRNYRLHWGSYIRVVRCMRRENIETLLAVDPLGLIAGGRVKRLMGGKIHLSYLSFEIFFKQELSGHYLCLKEKEISYSKKIDSLLVQDSKRAELLQRENQVLLPSSKIALVPVSPQKILVTGGVDLHLKLGIPIDKKLIVYSGSVGEWCGTGAILEAFDKNYWDNDYWLVFHTRKHIKAGELYSEDLLRLDADQHIPFSLHSHPFDNFEELSIFLSGFDAALALYYPNNDNPYYGMNMKEIGLSSGKFSTYMMLGLPTVVTSCSIYEELIAKYQFGAILDDVKHLIEAIQKVDQSKNEALKLYNEILDPEISLKKYVDLLG